jgi:hypothetical protein
VHEVRRAGMRTGAAALLVVGALVGPAPALAQDAGVIRGVVVNGNSESPVGGVEVVLTSALSDGTGEFVRRTRTDDRGSYTFRRLPIEDGRFFGLDAIHAGGMFAGGAVELTSDGEVETTLRVWPTIDDPEAIIVRRDNLFLSTGENGLDVIESATVVNTASEAYIGRAPGDGDPGTQPTIGFALPAGAVSSGVRIIDSTIDVPGLVETDFGFATTVALPPGEHRFTFAYRLRGTAGAYDFSRVALYPVLSTTVYAGDPLEVRSNRLEEAGSEEIGGTDYRLFSTTDALDPGDRLQISASAEASGSSGLTLGIVLAGLLAGGLIAFAVARRGGARAAAPKEPSRDDLVRAIAELDIRHDAGEIGDTEWVERRGSLRRDLEEMGAP